MFFHQLKYDLLSRLRDRVSFFWFLCFPIILSTFFYVSFGTLYEKDEVFQSIPVAVVVEQENQIFQTVLDSVEASDAPLFQTTQASEQEAMELLRNEEIAGIFYVNDTIRLAVAGENSLKGSILTVFLTQYEQQTALITSIAKSNPQKLPAVVLALQEDTQAVCDDALTQGNMDPYVSYFFNLIAMVALFGTTSGCIVTVKNQANLSMLGMRKSVAPARRFVAMLSGLISGYFVQLICVCISITYILFVLGIQMGDRIFAIYLSGAASTLVGVAIGFFIGSIGNLSEHAKNSLCMIFTLGSCFFSGLMVGNMKTYVAAFCPLLNKINPATVMSELFYCLILYEDYTRYLENLLILAAMAVIFTLAGLLLTRRKNYAHL